MGLTSSLRRLTNFSRHATKVASSSLQGVVSAAQKPTSQADYVETGHLYISKALIIRILLALVALALIGYFVVWPFVLSRFMTARFYEKDKRVANWDGRVIVYSDEKKTIPLYAGRLEDGVLQGECKQYDREGLLLYEGQLKDGLRSGSGKEYEDGILAYEGQFDAGLYNGRGKRYADGKLVYDGQYVEGLRSGSGTAYQNGKPLYEGQFMDDLYEGRGKLYQDGALCYDGSFHAGVAEGTGTAYYPSGKISYQGQFLAGKADGTGTTYSETGRKVYTGSYAEGEYSGEGTYFFADGSQVDAGFENGKPAGTAEWKKNGILYYQGEWDDGAPSGFGTIYSKAGKKLYEGPFLGGTIDGRSLLDCSTEELRAMLCESSLKNENDGTGFRIIAEELGVTALCTFQTESEESKVYQIYLSAPEKSDWVNLLPGMGHIQGVSWPQGVTPEERTFQYIGQPGVNVAAGTYTAENAVSAGRRTTVLYSNETKDRAVLLTWERQDAVPDPTAAGGSGGSGSDAKVEKLLKAMDKMIDSEGTVGSTGAYFGGVPTDNAFVETTSMAEAVGLADALIDFWEESERLHALEEITERNDTLLSDARNAAAKGVGTLDRIHALEQEQLERKAQIETTKTAIKRAELQAGTSGVAWISGYALEEMLVSFNPADQDVSGLALFAATYAKATGREVDPVEIENEVKDGLLNLSDAHGAAKLALARYQTHAEDTQSAFDAYSMGLGSKEAWYEAINEESLARVELCAALADFSKLANHFNQLTGGWVSRTFNWHRDVFEARLRAEIVEEEPEAGAAEEPATGSTEEPATASMEEPATGAAEEPEAGSTKEPETGAAEEPETGGTEEPVPGAAEEPEADGAEEPVPGAAEEPEAGSAEYPETGAAEEPEADDTEEPALISADSPAEGSGADGAAAEGA